IPWVHNVKNTDLAIAIDDRDSMALLRLFNEKAGKDHLEREAGLSREQVESLALMGISGIANMLCCIKFAKYYELTSNDVVATVLTDSVDMYRSRLEELREERGEYRPLDAAADFAASLLGEGTDNMAELTYTERKRIHNLKYYTWVEQQGRTAEELDDQWYHQEKSFLAVQGQAAEIDALIDEFNSKTGLLPS
ncbi:MAG: pyridoxal-5-phosphate-dependent protein subunit beta, partial [Treponema sp.]|nr:pyridoxal-5-phosphate-dependent protein subunit beta [Treponema sp.]